MKNGFLIRTARQLLKQDLSKTVVFVPNHRTGLYLQYRLMEESDSTIWLPKFCTITDWVKEISGWEIADEIDLLLFLYDTYQKRYGAISTEEFLPIARLILKDFDAIDKFLIDPKSLYSEDLMSGVSNMIHSAGLIVDEGLSKRFDQIWKNIPELYEDLKIYMSDRKLAYPGHILRASLEQQLIVLESENYHFTAVGFYWLNNAQLKFFDLLAKSKASFFWNRIQHSSGELMDSYIQRYGNSLGPDKGEAERQVKLISTPGLNFQTKLTAKFLEKNNHAPNDIAVVLPTDAVMIPMIGSIPEKYLEINVAMGLSLRSTPVYSLYKVIEQAIQESRDINNERFVARKYFQAFLNNEYVQAYTRLKANALDVENWPLQLSQAYLREQIAPPNYYEGLFFSKDFLFYLEEFCVELYNSLSEVEDDGSSLVSEIHLQSLYYLCLMCRRILDQLEYRDVEISRKLQLSFLHRMIIDESIPFKGEPVRGLQVLGHLEAVNLSFDTVYFLGQNEGIYPSVGIDTLIPSSLRQIYGLPTTSTIAKVKQFEFYSVVHSAKEVFLLFTESTQKSFSEREPNRYIQHFLYDLSNNESEAIKTSLEMYAPQAEAPTIFKTEDVMELMKEYMTERGLSPSAMIDYLQCRLKFYFGRTIRDRNSYGEYLDARAVGEIAHEVLYGIYKSRKGKLIEDLDSNEEREKIISELSKVYQKYYPLPDDLMDQGEVFIYKNYLSDLLTKIIRFDASLDTFSLEGLEETYSANIKHSEHTVKLKGTIDRIDSQNARTRLIDYKSKSSIINKVKLSQMGLDSFHENAVVVFQLLVYSWIYLKNFPMKRIRPVVYDLFAKDMSKVEIPLFLDGELLEDLSLNDLKPIEDLILEIIEDIMDESIAFYPTDDFNTCKTCDFNRICLRNQGH